MNYSLVSLPRHLVFETDAQFNSFIVGMYLIMFLFSRSFELFDPFIWQKEMKWCICKCIWIDFYLLAANFVFFSCLEWFGFFGWFFYNYGLKVAA